MKDTVTSAKVGLFIVIAIVATYLVYRFVEERSGDEGGVDVYAVFDDAQGLVPKSRVLVAGIQVGYIKDIRLEGDRARVDVHINPGITLFSDAKVAKKTASILGEAVLVINPGTVGGTEMTDGSEIAEVEAAAGTDEILENVNEIAKSVRSVTEQLERTFGTDEGGRQMAVALESLSEALVSINRTIDQNESVIGATLQNLERTTGQAGPQIVRVLNNVEEASADVRSIISDSQASLTSAANETDDTVASIHRASSRLESVLSDVEEVTGRTAAGEGTIGRLTSDETLIDEFEEVAEGISDLVGPIARLQTIVELKSEYNFIAGTFKNYVSLRLQPREDSYYYVQLINDPRGRAEFVQTQVRTSPAPEGVPPFYEETRIVTEDAFRFSLMFAKRVAFATFRFGILESTGGIGADLHFFDNKLEVTADIFAFGVQSLPRLRMRLAYEIVGGLNVVGGVDDTLNDTGDFFLGAMLRFDDEDLTSLLTVAGGALGGATN